MIRSLPSSGGSLTPGIWAWADPENRQPVRARTAVRASVWNVFMLRSGLGSSLVAFGIKAAPTTNAGGSGASVPFLREEFNPRKTGRGFARPPARARRSSASQQLPAFHGQVLGHQLRAQLLVVQL